jgi:hypothetical protein
MVRANADAASSRGPDVGARVKRLLCVLLPLLAAGWPLVAHADARVVGIDPHDAELVKRVDGQTQDLPITWRWLLTNVAIDLAAVARDQHADLVVQVERERHGGRVVNVYDAKRKQLRTRAAPQPQHAERFSASTAIEAAALIVRGEIKAALAADGDAALTSRDGSAATGGGGVGTGRAARTDAGAHAGGGMASGRGLGTDASPGATASRSGSSSAASSGERRTQAVESPARAVLRVEPTVVAAPTEPPEYDPMPIDTGAPSIMHERLPLVQRFGALISAGLSGDLPDANSPMLSGVLGARVRLAWAEVGLVAGTSLSSELHATATSIELRRSSFGAELAGLLPLSERVEAGLGVGVGLVFFARSTRTAAALRKTPDHTSLSPSLGPLAELRWRCTPALRLAARAGLSFVPRPTRFAYDGPNASDPPRELSSFAFLEPWAGVAMLLDFWERP